MSLDTSPHGLSQPAGVHRTRAFVAVVLLCALGAAGYATHVALRRQAAAAAAPALQPAVHSIGPVSVPRPDDPPETLAGRHDARGSIPSPLPAGEGPATLPPQAMADPAPAAEAPVGAPPRRDARSQPRAAPPVTPPRLLYRSTALGEAYGRVMLAEPGTPSDAGRLTPLQCDRVHYAAGHGICLQAKRGVITTYQARLFNAAFELAQSYPLAGPPSRARVSPDGRLAAMTVFVSGHGYSNGSFTTRTSVIDARSGQPVVDDLESFSVTRDGAPFKSVDFNFWGITFTRDSNRFFATLGTGDKRYLVEGDLAGRRMRVIHDAVECPSLSPDNRRIAFKRRAAAETGGRVHWQLHVLELASGRETALPLETHNVDDQVEWLDDGQVVYALPDDSGSSGAASSSWALAADGSAPPRLLQRYAFSPAVLRSE